MNSIFSGVFKKSVLTVSMFLMIYFFGSMFIVTDTFAAIPLVTDDTGTQGKGKFQTELFGEYGDDKEDEIRTHAWDPAYALGGFIYSPLENLDIGMGVKSGLTKPEADISIRGGITFRF